MSEGPRMSRSCLIALPVGTRVVGDYDIDFRKISERVWWSESSQGHVVECVVQSMANLPGVSVKMPDDMAPVLKDTDSRTCAACGHGERESDPLVLAPSLWDLPPARIHQSHTMDPRSGFYVTGPDERLYVDWLRTGGWLGL